MKHGGNLRFGLLAGAFLGASAMMIIPLVAAENPYNAIIERNVFNLHPPPPPVNPADLVKKAPPPKVLMTGISTLSGRKVVFLTLPPLKPGGPPELLTLAEGQAQDEIEVKSIDDKAGVVQIVNHGEPQPLDFEHDSPKPTGAPPGAIPSPIAMPAPFPAAPTMPAPGSVVRPMRSLPARNSSAENNYNGGMSPGVAPANFNQLNRQQQANLTPEEQVALIELQRVKALQEHDPVSAILPTTELTPEVMGQQQPAPQ